MATDKRNPFATAHDFMGSVRTSFEVSRDNDRPAENRPIRVSFSVGTGRGNSRPEMTGDQFTDLVSFLCDGDPVVLSLNDVANAGDLSPAQVAARSLTVDDDSVSFKVSDASGSRTVKVPRNLWGDFSGFLSRARDVLPSERDLIWPVKMDAEKPEQGD